VILLLALIGVVVLVISGPLRAARRTGGSGSAASPLSTRDGPAPRAEFERDELEAEREAKYREIRDAELDYRTGKLSREDFEAIDGGLRAEAIEILNRLQESESDGQGVQGSSGSAGAAE
jgi:hypothetical protein